MMMGIRCFLMTRLRWLDPDENRVCSFRGPPIAFTHVWTLSDGVRHVPLSHAGLGPRGGMGRIPRPSLLPSIAEVLMHSPEQRLGESGLPPHPYEGVGSIPRYERIELEVKAADNRIGGGGRSRGTLRDRIHDIIGLKASVPIFAKHFPIVPKSERETCA